ncbi:hypothetical protein [Terrabacter sp. NPDC080008]|uniref:hypothetical protein n=1 Tax=Terrabacter sp. NPDC080008 TaxID=3155176 RepID=UPI00344B2FDF
MDLPLRVAPEVRLRSSASGLRAALGEGTDGVDARAEEGRRAPARLADLEHRARTAQDAGDVQALRDVEEALTSLHLENHPLRRRPDPPGQTALPAKERAMLQRKALRSAQPKISVFKRAARAKTRAVAETEADHFVRTLDVAHAVIAQHRAAAVDDRWNALSGHDRSAVIAELEAVFAAEEPCCTCVDAGWNGGTSRAFVTVVARFPGLDLVAERGPGASSSGRGMLHPRTQAERNALYLSAIASFGLTTVRRVISVAVTADDVHLLVVRAAGDGKRLEPVYVGTITREDVTLRPVMADPVPLLLAAATRPVRFDGPAHDLVALDPDPVVDAVVRACADALEDHELDGLLEGATD